MHHLWSGIICLIVENSFVFFELALSRGMGETFCVIGRLLKFVWIGCLRDNVGWLLKSSNFFHAPHTRTSEMSFSTFLLLPMCSDLLFSFEKKFGWNVLHYYWIVLWTHCLVCKGASLRQSFCTGETSTLTKERVFDILLFDDKSTWSWSFTFLVLFQKPKILIFEV